MKTASAFCFACQPGQWVKLDATLYGELMGGFALVDWRVGSLVYSAIT